MRGGARRESPLPIGRRVAVAMGAVRADWPGRVSVVAGQIPGAGQVRGAGRGGRRPPGWPAAPHPLIHRFPPRHGPWSTRDAEGSRDFAVLGLRVSEPGSFSAPPSLPAVPRSEGRGSAAVWKAPVLSTSPPL